MRLLASYRDSAAAIVAHYAVPVKPPVTPVPAATVVLLRDRSAGGFDVLLLQRHRASKFAAGDYVFPGGKVEVGDNPPDAARFCAGLEPEAAGALLGVDAETALAFWIGAIRETFEETGVLLAYDRDGGPAHVKGATFDEYRNACQVEPAAFWQMVRTEALTLATDRLVYLAHWITPEESPLRFDTRFFAAEMPAGQEAIGDGTEIIDVRWLQPAEALEAAKRGEISLRNPTVRNIELFLGAGSVAHALERLHGRVIPMIRPRVIMKDGARQVLMPGDPGYW
jgi:8-oxo-dGTP pyrophosphatase MutT (NUDIX family)